MAGINGSNCETSEFCVVINFGLGDCGLFTCKGNNIFLSLKPVFFFKQLVLLVDFLNLCFRY